MDLLEISEGRIVICQGKWWLCGESPQGLQLRVGVARRPHSTCLFTTGGIECRCAQFKVFVVMVSRYPSAILWHGLDFGGRDTPVTTILKPTRAPGNNAGLGPPVARSSTPTATHLVGVPTQLQVGRKEWRWNQSAGLGLHGGVF